MKKLDPKVDGSSRDIVADNVSKLKEIFPEVFTEGKIDYNALREVLGDYIEHREERYSFTWHGKSRARRIAQTPSTGTLRPCPEESVNWDTTQNLFIEGDNLEVLKLMQKSYHKKVKMIYIDPPYNTGKEFIYPDKFQDNLETYLRYTGQIDDEGFKMSANTETSGRYHTNWLNMMYPRLRLARNLLRDDGVIFISIGNEELHNVIAIMNEIFGEECFKNVIIIRRGKKSVQAQFETVDALNRGYEYLVFYAKSSDYRFPTFYVPTSNGDDIKGSWNNHWRGTDRPTMRYELFGIIPSTGQWRWGKERSLTAAKNWETLVKELGELPSIDEIDEWVVSRQFSEKLDLLRLSSTGKPEHYVHPSDKSLANDLWIDIKPNGSSQLRRIFEERVFDNPKSTDLITRLLELSTSDSEGIILDFFAGSGSTAEAMIRWNIETQGMNQFIMVQLPEPCDENSEAFKAGYKTIADIGKERIRRVIKKIEAERVEEAHTSQGQLPGTAEDYLELDLGFKVFKLDSSNIKPWDPDLDALEHAVYDAVDNIKSDRTHADVLYELLLKQGLDLAIPIEERFIEGKKTHVIGGGALVVCLEDDIDLPVAEGIALLKVELEPEIMHVIFKDSGFQDDVVKTNTMQILQRAGIDKVVSV